MAMIPQDNYTCRFGLRKDKWYQIIECNGKQCRRRPIDVNQQFKYEKEWEEAIVVYRRTGKSPVETLFGTPSRTDFIDFKMFAKRLGKASNFIVFSGAGIKWEEIDNEKLYEYRDWLDNMGYSTNSQRTYMASLKQVLDKARMLGYPLAAKDYAKILFENVGKCVNVYLTMSELTLLEACHFQDEYMESARVRFLIGCFTGARFSDYSRLREASITEGEYLDSNGVIRTSKHIQYISQKTDTYCKVPCSSKVENLLKRNLKNLSRGDFNRLIPEVCRIAGVTANSFVIRGDKKQEGEKWNFVTSHTARRTFANNLYMLGVPIETISKYLGHSSIETTMRNYIMCPLRISEFALSKYFGDDKGQDY